MRTHADSTSLCQKKPFQLFTFAVPAQIMLCCVHRGNNYMYMPIFQVTLIQKIAFTLKWLPHKKKIFDLQA